jgi:hypothetical protein
MILRTLAPLIASTVVLAGCSGGGGSSTNGSTQALPNATQAATGTLTIGAAPAGTASNKRRPAYVSPSTTFATLWIDGSTTGDRQACSPGAGAGGTGTCTINWVSTSGAHTFTVAVDDATSINGPGNILADYSLDEVLQTGVNSLPNITLNGVVAQTAFVSETLYPAGNSNCGSASSPNCFYGKFDYLDADGNAIVAPGNFDGGGACINPSNTPGANYNCLPFALSPGLNEEFGAICAPGENDTFTFVGASYAATNPSEAGRYGINYGEVSPAQQATYSLVYPNQTSYVMNNWPTYSCVDGTIATVGPANGGVVVQKHH